MTAYKKVVAAKNFLLGNNHFLGCLYGGTPQEVCNRLDRWVSVVAADAPGLGEGLFALLQSGTIYDGTHDRQWATPPTSHVLAVWKECPPFMGSLTLNWVYVHGWDEEEMEEIVANREMQKRRC